MFNIIKLVFTQTLRFSYVQYDKEKVRKEMITNK